MTTTTTTTHPDLAHIRRVANELDRAVYDLKESTPDPVDRIKEVLGGTVDFEALHVAAAERAAGMLDRVNPMLLLLGPTAFVEAVWAEAFSIGLRFQATGGTAAPEEDREQ
jgi:hypothetical protein